MTRKELMARYKALVAKGFPPADSARIVQKQTGYSLKTGKPIGDRTDGR